MPLRGLSNARLPFDGFGNVSTYKLGHVVMANIWLDLTKSEDIPDEAVVNARMLVLLDYIQTLGQPMHVRWTIQHVSSCGSMYCHHR
jgi:hypothetical protein